MPLSKLMGAIFGVAFDVQPARHVAGLKDEGKVKEIETLKC